MSALPPKADIKLHKPERPLSATRDIGGSTETAMWHIAMLVEEQWFASVAGILTPYGKTHISSTRIRPDSGSGPIN